MGGQVSHKVTNKKSDKHKIIAQKNLDFMN